MTSVPEDLVLEGIRYSRVWEDQNVLNAALQIGPDDDVLSVSSAGDNVLSLLLAGPRSIVAVDFNPAQNALLELHLAAIRLLSHDEYIRILGVIPGTDRMELYDRIRDQMPNYAANFWDANTALIDTGIVSLGRLDLYFRLFKDLHLIKIHPVELSEKLFEFDDLAEQNQWFLANYATDELREVVEWYFGREMLEKRGRSEVQMTFVDMDEVGRHFWDRFVHTCATSLLKDNFYARLIMLGEYGDLSRGPAHLRPKNFDRLQASIERIRVETTDIASLVSAEPKGRFSKANLSDLFEYLPEKTTEETLRLLSAQFRTGGRIAWWELLVPRPRPATLSHLFRSDSELARKLWQNDRVWFYRGFHIEEIIQ